MGFNSLFKGLILYIHGYNVIICVTEEVLQTFRVWRGLKAGGAV